ncbi:MAG: hypothetical protein HKL90_16540 [Elusimicrobia bacterium]|nr:hypothetical protein [Elusimicrobiota bacterium]
MPRLRAQSTALKRRALAALPLLAAAAALHAGFGNVPRAAAALAGACAAAAFLAAAAPGQSPAPWLSAAAAFCAAAAARLLGLWSADPALGFALTASAAAAGAALGAAGPAPDRTSALTWAAAGGMLVAAQPALLRFLGANSAEPRRLFYPWAGNAWFLLGQPALLLAAAAACAARAARGLTRPRTRMNAAAPFFGAALAAALIPRLEPSSALGFGGAALALIAVLRARPWAAGSVRPLRARALAALAAAALVFAAASPFALFHAWTARLDSLYPGGAFLGTFDDGASAWTAYRFSRGERVLLRDGVIQRDDTGIALLSLSLALGQSPRGADCSILLARPPGPQTVSVALGSGCRLEVLDGGSAQTAALNAALGAGWRTLVSTDAAAADAELEILPTPWDRDARRQRLSAASLGALRVRLAPNGAAAFLLPAFDSTPAALDEIQAAAAAAFGGANSAVLPSGDGIVLAGASASALEEADVLIEDLPPQVKTADVSSLRRGLAAIRWRPRASAK